MKGPSPGRKLVIQIPCLDEEVTLPATVAALPRDVDGFDVVEWLVVDDGSTDRTTDVARALGVDHVVQHGDNRGLAAAFLTGLDAALRVGADVIVNTDADNQYDASFLPALVAPVLAGEADVVVGERPIESIPEFSWTKKRLQRIGSWVVRRFSGTDIADAASGFRAFSREAALRLRVVGRHTYTLETLVQAGAEDLVVTSVPVGVNPPTRESRLVASSAQYVRRSAQAIVRADVMYRPRRFFAVLGWAWVAVGVLVRRVRARQPPGEAARGRRRLLARVPFVLAVASWLVGVLAERRVSQRRHETEAIVERRRAALGLVATP